MSCAGSVHADFAQQRTKLHLGDDFGDTLMDHVGQCHFLRRLLWHEFQPTVPGESGEHQSHRRCDFRTDVLLEGSRARKLQQLTYIDNCNQIILGAELSCAGSVHAECTGQWTKLRVVYDVSVFVMGSVGQCQLVRCLFWHQFQPAARGESGGHEPHSKCGGRSDVLLEDCGSG